MSRLQTYPKTRRLTVSDAFSKLLADLEAGIRAGLIPQVKKRLAGINGARLPREYRLPFANFCRRAGMVHTAIRFLAPAVADGRGGHGEKASAQELAEYAVLLQRLGVLDEAFKILRGLDVARVPETLLYQSYCHFNRWEYFESIPLLRAYVGSSLPPYKKLIGQVNLAAALTAVTDFQEALELLGEAIAAAREGNHRRLEGNGHEIRAQVFIGLGELGRAYEELSSARDLLGGEGTVAELSVLKWQAVADAFKTKDPDPLHKFRARALEAGEWEAVRHTDLHLLKLRFDEKLFRFHLFGSPWLGYRESAQRSLGRVIADSHFDNGSGGPLLDVENASLDGRPLLAKGGKLHRALGVLAADFYRPVPLGTLFAALFAGEYFDPFSSPNRIHQCVFRLRKEIPLAIDQTAEGYSLKFNQPVILRVPYEKKDLSANQELLRRSQKLQWGPEGFSIAGMADELQLSKASARRFVAWALEQGWLDKTGAGPSTRYYLKEKRFKTAA